MARASASLSSTGSKPQDFAAAIISSLLAFPFPVANLFIVPRLFHKILIILRNSFSSIKHRSIFDFALRLLPVDFR
jgi:hypothetical protein